MSMDAKQLMHEVVTALRNELEIIELRGGALVKDGTTRIEITIRQLPDALPSPPADEQVMQDIARQTQERLKEQADAKAAAEARAALVRFHQGELKKLGK